MKIEMGLPIALVLAAGIGGAAVAAERVRIVNEGGLSESWTAAAGARFDAPGYPAQYAGRGDNVCLAIGYAVRPDGSTSDFSLLKAWNSASGEDEPEAGYWEAFGQAGAAAISDWKFQPRPDRQVATTYTVATLHFKGREAADVASLTGHCKVADLAWLIQQKKADFFFTGMDKHQLERHRRLQDSYQLAQAAASAAWQAQRRNPPPPPVPTP